MKPQIPAAGSQEYLWWSQGARDECEARDEGLSFEVRDMRYCLENLPGGPPQIAAALARIYCPSLPLRRRIGLAWRLLRG